jgi:hypothetical protein
MSQEALALGRANESGWDGVVFDGVEDGRGAVRSRKEQIEEVGL